MRLSEELCKRVGFAHFCTTHKIEPRDVAELITLAKRAAKAGERVCNAGGSEDDRERKAARRFEDKAGAMGLAVDWPGLYPSIQDKDGYELHLPY